MSNNTSNPKFEYFDSEKIWRASDNGLLIFKYYFPNEDLTNPNKKFKQRAEEKTASARVYFWKTKYLIADYGNSSEVNGMNAIDYVKYRENLIYVDACRFIQDVILRRDCTRDGFVTPKYSAEFDWREMTPEDVKGEYRFTYKEVATETDLSFIGRYITSDLLKEFKGRVVEQYEYCTTNKRMKKDMVMIVRSTEHYPIFVFDYGDFKKKYEPMAKKKAHRFIFIGKKTKDYIYGLDRLLSGEDEFIDEKEGDRVPPKNKPDALVKDLIRCSGESDALNLASLGFHVYWLNSESAAYGDGQYKRLDDLCERHYQVFDIDATGQRFAGQHALAHINLHTIQLPTWLGSKMDPKGGTCKDVKDFCNIVGKNEDDTRTEFIRLKQKAKTVKFWFKSKDKNGNTTYNISLEHVYYMLNMHGFWYTPSKYHRNSDFCFAREEGKVVYLIKPDDIAQVVRWFIREWIISKNFMDEIALLNKINGSNQLNKENLRLLPVKEFNFHNADDITEYLHFKNGSFRITREQIEKVKHEDIPNSILGELIIIKDKITHVLPHNTTLLNNERNPTPLVDVQPSKAYGQLLEELKQCKLDDERQKINDRIGELDDTEKYDLQILDKDFILVKYLKDLSRIHWRKEMELNQELTRKEKKQQELLFINLLYVLGYNLAQFKDPVMPWMTFMQDYLISEIGTSSGRSGKSLFSALIEHCRPCYTIDGRSLGDKKAYEFVYDGLTEFHSNIILDDMHEFADINFFYTAATGPRIVNSKFLSKEKLSYSQSSKLFISSNFELPNMNSSTLARFIFSAVSDFYHEKTPYNDYKETRSPFSRFGRRLYDNFTPEEWNKTYNLCAYAIQLFMRFEKINPPMENIVKRQLRREMSKGLGRGEDFMKWAQMYFAPLPAETHYLSTVGEVCVSPNDAGYFDTYIVKEYAYQHFLTEMGINASKFKVTQFKKNVAHYCEYMGWEMNPPKMCTEGKDKKDPTQRTIKRKVDDKSREVLYVVKPEVKTVATPSPAPKSAAEVEDLAL